MGVILTVLKKIWALPNTLIGLLYGIIGLFIGAKVHWENDIGVLRFTDMPRNLLGSAISLGHVQLFSVGYFKTLGGSYTPNRLGTPIAEEETWHTRQAEVLGPFYLLFYLAGLLISLATTKTTHHNNFMEKGPENGAGLWPWDVKNNESH